MSERNFIINELIRVAAECQRRRMTKLYFLLETGISERRLRRIFSSWTLAARAAELNLDGRGVVQPTHRAG